MDQKLLKFIPIILFGLLLIPPALLGQVGTSVGYFSISAKTSAGKKQLANVGHFRLIYEIPVGDKFSIKPSYSLYVLGFGSGDLGYGMNLATQYYPFSLNRRLVYKNTDLFFYSAEIFRPYAKVSFHQRQYQSIQSNYAGLGFGAGTDYQWQQDVKLNLEMSFMSLSGPLEAQITEFQINLGGSLEF